MKYYKAYDKLHLKALCHLLRQFRIDAINHQEQALVHLPVGKINVFASYNNFLCSLFFHCQTSALFYLVNPHIKIFRKMICELYTQESCGFQILIMDTNNPFYTIFIEDIIQRSKNFSYGTHSKSI